MRKLISCGKNQHEEIYKEIEMRMFQIFYLNGFPE